MFPTIISPIMIMRRDAFKSRTLPLLLLLILVSSHIFQVSSSSSASKPSAYSALGVTTDSTQEEMKAAHRKLCLKYHPDKVPADATEKEKDEGLKKFREVREAYEQVGSPEARTEYDLSRRRAQYEGNGGGGGGAGGGGGGGGGGYGSYDDVRGRGSYGSPFQDRRSRTYFNGVDVTRLFGGNPLFSSPSSFGSAFATAAHSQQQAVPGMEFVQHVSVPLDELYMGGTGIRLDLNLHPLSRHIASARGGFAFPLAVRTFLGVWLPVWARVGWFPATAAFAVLFQLGLPPPPSRSAYATAVGKGWRGGTKIRFAAERGGIRGMAVPVEVYFVVKEGSHDRFRRDGDDLRTTVCIGRSDAHNGCQFQLKPLGGWREKPISVILKAGEVGGSEDQEEVGAEDGNHNDNKKKKNKNRGDVIIKGRGWPLRNGQRGDLIVTVLVVSDKKAQKEKEKGRQRAP